MFKFDVPQEENTQKNIYYSFTELGIERLGFLNINKAFDDMLGKNLGNFTFTLSGFEFFFKNIQIIEMLNPVVSASMHEDTQTASIIMDNLRLDLTFEFIMQQNIYPYTSDSGVGTINLGVGGISFQGQAL